MVENGSCVPLSLQNAHGEKQHCTPGLPVSVKSMMRDTGQTRGFGPSLKHLSRCQPLSGPHGLIPWRPSSDVVEPGLRTSRRNRSIINTSVAKNHPIAAFIAAKNVSIMSACAVSLLSADPSTYVSQSLKSGHPQVHRRFRNLILSSSNG